MFSMSLCGEENGTKKLCLNPTRPDGSGIAVFALGWVVEGQQQ